MCSHTRRQISLAPPAPLLAPSRSAGPTRPVGLPVLPLPFPGAAEPVRSSPVLAAPDRRVGDRERDAVHVLLGQALADGYLDRQEFDSRTDRALVAPTARELATLTTDLPVAELRRRDPARREARARAGRLGVRIHLSAFLAVVAMSVLVWLLVGISGGSWYPWPVWPALGGAIGVVSHAVPVHLAHRERRLGP